MSYVPFSKPYPNGWADGSEGNTPITANILNNNYDSFLTGLNDWAVGIPEVYINPESPGVIVGNATILKVGASSYRVSEVEANPAVPGGTTPPDLERIGIDGTVYSIPSGGGSGSVVSWTQIQNTGTKIAEIDINGTSTEVYAPTSGGASYTDLTANISSGATTVTINDASITTSSAFFPFSDPFGLTITNMVATTGSITITFLPAASNYTLKVRVW